MRNSLPPGLRISRAELAVSSPTLAFNLKNPGGSQLMWTEYQSGAKGLSRTGPTAATASPIRCRACGSRARSLTPMSAGSPPPWTSAALAGLTASGVTSLLTKTGSRGCFRFNGGRRVRVDVRGPPTDLQLRRLRSLAAGRGVRYAGIIRYPDGGGLTAAERTRREQVRLAELDAVLEAGPAACGYEDQCWTLARIAEEVWQRFGVEYTLAGMDVLLHRSGWSVQVPARRAAERDEAAIARWREKTWPVVKGRQRTPGAWLVFEDESGQGLKPPKGRTWGRRGQTPVVTVTGGSNKRVSLAALIAVKPGQGLQLI
jgi:transposase